MATDPYDQVTARIPTEPFMGMVAVNLIEESLTNPRKHFDPVKLQELADSIKASGVHQPILLRPLPGSRVPDTWGFRRKDAPLPIYELVAGARRLRACKLAKVAKIPAMVRDLTDDQALEAQLIENLRREDMTDLEEAEGYRALMEHSKLTVEQVADRIGKGDQKNKGKSYVYARLKLLDLHADARKALEDGTIDTSRALRIARIPTAKLQKKALEEASRKNYRGDPTMGVREFEGWLQQNVMLRLESAPFPIVSADLVPAAGSCKTCPKRTGADPDLFADVNSPDLCTDPDCYHGKEAAHSAALRAQAEAKGMRVIEGKEAKGIVQQYSSQLKGYTRLDTTHCLPGREPASMRELLGDSAPQPVLIEHPQTKELIEAVPTDEAEAVLVQRGVLQTTQQKINLDERIAMLKQQSARKQERAAGVALFKAFTESARTSPAPAKVMADAELLREWLKLVVNDLDHEDTLTVAGIEPIEDEDWSAAEERAIARIDRAKDGEVRSMMLVWMLMHHGYEYSRDNGRPLVAAIARALGLDAAAITAEAVAAEKQELKEAIEHLRAAAKAQEKKPSAPLPPAALAVVSRAKAKGSKGPAARAGADAPRTTSAEASAQIAAGLAALEGDGQAPAAQGNDAPAVPAGQPAASAAPGAGDGARPRLKNQAPAAQGDEAPPVPDGQAAASVAPKAVTSQLHPASAWPFPTTPTPAPAAASRAAPGGHASADVSEGAAAKPGELAIDVHVRVLPTATGKKQAPHIGKVGKILRRVGPEAWDVAVPREKRGVPMFVAFHSSELEVVA